MTQPNENNLIWIDLEMTGLNADKDRIIEIASIVTDTYLNVLAEGPVLAIHQNQFLLDTMDQWNKSQHGQSGLIKRVQETHVTEAEAETKTLHFIKQYVPANCSPICGNSIWQDRRFLARHMPTLENYFQYRQLDVSTVKILAQRWAPQIANGFTKASTHLALQDIYDSIEELRYYRSHLLKI